MTYTGFRFLITSIPPGEAPEWVRQQWVGLALPLAQRSAKPRKFLTVGVISGPRSLLGNLLALITGRFSFESGHLVECLAALAVLEQTSPEAAAWWKDNLPHLFQPGRVFMFHIQAGHVIE